MSSILNYLFRVLWPEVWLLNKCCLQVFHWNLKREPSWELRRKNILRIHIVIADFLSYVVNPIKRSRDSQNLICKWQIIRTVPQWVIDELTLSFDCTSTKKVKEMGFHNLKFRNVSFKAIAELKLRNPVSLTFFAEVRSKDRINSAITHWGTFLTILQSSLQSILQFLFFHLQILRISDHFSKIGRSYSQQ